MATFTENLVVEVSANTTQLSQGLNQASQDVSRFGGEVEDAEGDVRGFDASLGTGGLTTAITGVLAVGGGLIALLVKTQEEARNAAQEVAGLVGSVIDLQGVGKIDANVGQVQAVLAAAEQELRSLASQRAQLSAEAASGLGGRGPNFRERLQALRESEAIQRGVVQDLEKQLAVEQRRQRIANLFNDTIARQSTEADRMGLAVARAMSNMERLRREAGGAGGGGGVVGSFGQIADDSERTATFWERIEATAERLGRAVVPPPPPPPGAFQQFAPGTASPPETTEQPLSALAQLNRAIAEIREQGGIGRALFPEGLSVDEIGERFTVIQEGLNLINSFTADIGDNVASAILGFQSFGDAVTQVLENFAAAIISTGTQLLALYAIISLIPGAREFLELAGGAASLANTVIGGAQVSTRGSAETANLNNGGNVFAGQLTVGVSQVQQAQATGLQFNRRSGLSGF